jgi:hypothetical protein
MTATDTTVFSYSIVIRDMLLAKLVAAPFFADFTVRKSRQLPTQTNQLPYLGCYIISEDMEPEGDFNAGEIDFIHTLKLGFTVALVNNDPEACEEKLDQAFWVIMNTLWRDPYLMNFIDTRAYPGGVGNPDNTRIEGVSKGTRRHVFGTAQLNNETPIGELRYEASVKYRAEYAPIITDDFLQLGLRTGVKAGETQAEMDQRQQVGLELVFPATTARKDESHDRDEEPEADPREPAHSDP